MSVQTNNWFLDIALGRYQTSYIQKFGINDDVDTADVPEDIWQNGGTYVFPTAASTIGLVSSSANDAAAGTGVRTVRVSGLDADYNEIEEDMTLNGTGSVTSSQSFFRVHRVKSLTAGSTGWNEGTLTLTVDSKTVATVDPTRGQTQQAIYTIPKGKTGYLLNYFGSVGKTQSLIIQISLNIREVGGAWNTQPILGLHSSGTTFTKTENLIPTPIPEKTDVKMSVIDCSGNNASVAGGFEILLK